MAGFGFVEDIANVLSGGVAYIKLRKRNTTADAGRYSIGELQDSDISIESIEAPDSRKREHAMIPKVDIVAKSMNTDLAILQGLATISDSSLSIVAALLNGKIFSTADLTDPRMGLKWKFVSDADFDKNRFLEYTFDRKLMVSEYATVIGAPSDPGTETVGDVLYAIFHGIGESGIIPAGFTGFRLKKDTEGTYEVPGIFNGAKLTIEGISPKPDSIGRSKVTSCQVTAEVALQQTADEYAILGNMLQQKVDQKLISPLGTFTFAGKLGIKWKFNTKNADSESNIVLGGTGIIQLADLAGCIS